MSLNSGMCAVKQALVDDLASAHSALVALGDQEVAAAIAGDLDGLRALAVPLKSARERRDRATLAVREHIAAHHC
jgi:hypothetical protein